MDVANLLSNTSLFAALTDSELQEVVKGHRMLSLKRNDELFKEDATANSLYIVSSGRIGIVKAFLDRKESIVAMMEGGDLFGEMGLFDKGVRSATARALERSEVIEVEYEPIRSVLEGRPSLLWSLLDLMARRMRQTDDALTDAMFLDVTGRCAKRILELSQGNDEFFIPLTQEELAGLIGASRERVNKTIATFIRARYIEVNDRNYRITNRHQLEIIAG